ncbi:unnamed protein product [Calicophoron daubneyi]|uniref:Large ribosomal subunit protein mL37 n=1 Tax=Calicophoron daubneyi TaxID=300641 RepID=A0AAV2TFU7_CALDB
MRLTTLLCRGKRTYRDKLEFLSKKYWRERGSLMNVNRLRVPERLLKDPSNPLSKAEDMFTSTRYEDALAREIELGITPEEAIKLEKLKEQRLARWSPHLGDPRYHPESEPTLMFSNQRRFTKGLDQASLLTNTIILNGPPSGLSNLTSYLDSFLSPAKEEKEIDDQVKNASLPLQYQLRGAVERAILHAHCWHTDETKLPRRFCPELPIWHHKAEFGIHPQQITRFLFHNLFRILELQLPQMAKQFGMAFSLTTSGDQMPDRWTTRDRFLETHYYWGEEKRRIGFSEQHDLVVNGKRPAELHAPSKETVQALCESHALPTASLGPMSPLIDLTSTQYYLFDSTEGWKNVETRPYPHPHLITINLSLPNVWSDFLEPEAEPVVPEQRQAAALMHCFAATVARARTMGLSSGELEVPICVDGICSDGVYFDFISFQLNTLDVPDFRSNPSAAANTAIHNLAWVDGNHRLFDKQVPRRSMLRNTKYRDLDMSVFTRLAGRYLWGLVGNELTQIHDGRFRTAEFNGAAN